MFGNILYAYTVQLLFTVVTIFLFGFVISLCNKRFYANFGSKSRTVCYITGFAGTPVHELSHALFCLIFGHKITDIKLFDVDSDDGTLGYVKHTYNPKNFYQKIGNFFIGVAPIIVISALLYLFAYLLLPDFARRISSAELDVSDASGVFAYVGETLAAFFTAAADPKWWAFVVIGMFFALHMNLSGADIKSALSGLILLLPTLLLVDLILGLVSLNALSSFTTVVVELGIYMLCVFIIALIISLFALGLSFLVYLLRRRR